MERKDYFGMKKLTTLMMIMMLLCSVCLPAWAWEIAIDDEVIVLPSPGWVDITNRQCESAS